MSNSATPWTKACQASLSFTSSWSLLKLMMPSNHLILCHPLLLLPSVFPSIRVFSNESAPPNRWPKYWSFGSIGRVLEESFRVDFLQDWAYTLKFFNKSLLNFLQCCLCFMVFLFLFFWPWGIWYLNSPTWDQTHTTCIGRWSLDQQTAREVPILNFFYAWYLTMEK